MKRPNTRLRTPRPIQGEGAHVCALFLEGHPLDGRDFGVGGTTTPLVDLWFDERRLPDYTRAAPRR